MHSILSSIKTLWFSSTCTHVHSLIVCCICSVYRGRLATLLYTTKPLFSVGHSGSYPSLSFTLRYSLRYVCAIVCVLCVLKRLSLSYSLRYIVCYKHVCPLLMELVLFSDNRLWSTRSLWRMETSNCTPSSNPTTSGVSSRSW